MPLSRRTVSHELQRVMLRQERRSFKNFSRKRPETTNLNHQYAIRRLLMCQILDTEMALHTLDSPGGGASV
jgi:hypothetical protein